jgi:hypothetical protein
VLTRRSIQFTLRDGTQSLVVVKDRQHKRDADQAKPV